VRPEDLTAEQQVLVRATMALVARCADDVAGRYHGQVEARELLGPGTIALYESAVTYRPEQGVSFSHYARHNVRGRMHRAIKADRLSARERVEQAMEQGYEMVSAHLEEPDPFEVVDEKPLDLAQQDCVDVLTAALIAGLEADAEANGEGAILDRLALRREVAKLPPREQELLVLLYVQELTSAEAAKKAGLTLRTLHRRHMRVLAMLRVALGLAAEGSEPRLRQRKKIK
jgi:RNA polymerase sigma factor (sigma-70 family)